jgi:hypothetical protein
VHLSRLDLLLVSFVLDLLYWYALH